MAGTDWIDASGPARPAALAMAAVVTLAGAHAAFGRGAAPGLAMLLLLVAGAVVALLLLVRAELPPAVRGAAAGAILVALIACAVRSDPFGGTRRRAGTAIDRPVGSGSGNGAAGSGSTGRTGSASGMTGAAVALDGGRWADSASAALSGRIAEDVAGAAAWTIAGTLAAASDPDQAGRIAVSLDWRIAGTIGEARCGTLAVLATSAPQLDAALADAFAAAVRRSVRRGRAFCG